MRLDDEIRRHVEQRLAKHYQHLNVHVGSARFDKERGITIYDLSILEPHRDGTPEPLMSVEELYLAGQMRIEELLGGQPHVDRIVIQRATLRAVRQPDGKWNVKTLLPLPNFSDQTPTLDIKDATLILDGAGNGAKALTLRGIDATLTPIIDDSTAIARSHGSPRLRVQGLASGVPAVSLRFEGELGTTDGALNLSVAVEALELSPELLASVPFDKPAHLEDAKLHGRADAAFRIQRAAGSAAPIDWAVKLKLDGGRFAHPMLPNPITDLAAKLEATSHRLFVEQLTGRFGPADVVMACERQGWAEDAALGLAVRVTGLPLDERLPPLLPAPLARFWARFQPTGFADVNARVTFHSGRWSPTVTVKLKNASLTDVERFPYRLEKTDGDIVYRPATGAQLDLLTLNLTGNGGGQPIRIDGKFVGIARLRHNGSLQLPASPNEDSVAVTARKPALGIEGADPPAHRPIGSLVVSGTDVPVHEDLLAALPPEGERFARSLAPQGTIDFRWKAEWTDSAQPRANVTQEIQLKDCSIRYNGFRYPLQHINGLVTEENRIWKLHGVESLGGSGSTRVVCHGESVPIATGRHLDLVFQATDVPLDDNLRDALSLEAQRAWAEIRPQGRIDFTAHVVHETGQPKPTVDIVARPRDRSVSIQLKSFDYRLEQVEGEASFASGRVELRNVRTQHGRIAYSAASGIWEPTLDGGWKFALSGLNADRLTAHRGDLLAALPPRMQKTLERLQPDGAFNVINSSLNFEKRPGSDQLAAAWDVYLDCHQVTLGGTPLENISGAVRLRGQDDNETSYTTGELDIHSLIWKDIQFTNVRGPMWVDRSLCLFGRRATERLQESPRPITADAYGGSIAADASLQHDGNTRYQIEAAIGGANLNRFANERLGGEFSQLSGAVSGRLSIGGAGRTQHALKGTGELHVVDANIYELPMLVAMLKVLRNRTPNSTAFNQCDMKFRIEGEHIHFDQLNLVGDALSMYGRGESDFDRNVDLTFYALMGPVDLPIPLWRTVAGGLSEQSLQLKVVGKYDRPEIQRHVLPAVDQMLQQIQNQWDAGVDTVIPSESVRDRDAARDRDAETPR